MDNLQTLACPLVVDLDGTLIKTDTLLEALLCLFKKNPLYIFLLPVWLLRGKAYFKQQIAKRIELNPALLPYNQELLNYLYQQRSQGRQLMLATAADQSFAKKIADYLGIFDVIIASDGSHNLSGEKKLSAIKQHCPSFSYAGNHNVDIPIWKMAASAIVISTSQKLLNKVQKLNVPIEYKNTENTLSVKSLIKALRIHQWVKNLLLFIPLFTAYKFTELSSVTEAIEGFLAFSFCASAMYVFNDLLDLFSDRQHTLKKHRPFASGELSIPFGFLTIVLLMFLSFAFAFNISLKFSAVLIVYLLLTTTYSFYLKRIVLADVILLAILYVIRIIAGGIAINVPLSAWLLAFSLFFFLSLAFVKRASELQGQQNKGTSQIAGRGYIPSDLSQIVSFGSSSGYIAVLVFALYIHSDSIKMLYQYPQILWLCCPILLYWINRIWLLAHRGLVHEDPILFAIKDKVSYIAGFLILLLLFLAK